jgi:GNAT superfamily N-acetyltransferase
MTGTHAGIEHDVVMNAQRLRSATPDDAPALETIQMAVWRTTYPNPALGITLARIEATLQNLTAGGEERLRAVLRSPAGKTWVALADETVVGFVDVHVGTTVNTIEALHVLPGYHARGIGRCLLTRALAWLGSAAPSTSTTQRALSRTLMRRSQVSA